MTIFRAGSRFREEIVRANRDDQCAERTIRSDLLSDEPGWVINREFREPSCSLGTKGAKKLTTSEFEDRHTICFIGAVKDVFGAK
jgi:hypothetical protein